MSNCVSNFNIVALVVSEILGGSQIYVRGPCALLYAPSRKIFVPVNFNFLALVFSEILGGPKFTLRSPTPLDAP